MTPRRAREFNSCLPPEASLKVRGVNCSSPPAYKFLNSGLYAGRAGEVRSLLRSALLLPRELILNNKSSEDDQTATIRVWHEGKHKARSLLRQLEAATLCIRGRSPMRKRVHVRKRTQPIFIRGCNLLYEQIALDYGASLFWSLSGTTGESFRFDLSRPRIRPAWSNEAACFVHAAGGCHLPRKLLRSHPLLDTICSLRRSNFSSNELTLAPKNSRQH